jgi:diacylglycerol O-acyltransferase
MFLIAETREHPTHVGGLQLFQPPGGATALDIRAMFDAAMKSEQVAPLFQKRPRRSLATLGQWAWEKDEDFDIEHHVRRNALPHPGRILELLALCSRLHSSLLDRNRPLWELHLIEGLQDGRFAMYFKAHHALMDGISALRMLSRVLSEDEQERDMPAPWAPRKPRLRAVQGPVATAAGVATTASLAALRGAVDLAAVGPSALRTLGRALTGSLPLSAPRTILNVPITGARRFAAQSWPLVRIKAVGRASGTTVNDVVLAMCSGALRTYLESLDALPDQPLVAMVPVSLHGEESEGGGDGGGNATGLVLCNLGTHLADPAARLITVHESMAHGKASLAGLSQLQIFALSAATMSPSALDVLLPTTGVMNPAFNLIISNVPGPRQQMFWNGARLDGLYPLSIPFDGQALNITCTSYADELAFGLLGCRRRVPHLQRLLTYLGDELTALEEAVSV